MSFVGKQPYKLYFVCKFVGIRLIYSTYSTVYLNDNDKVILILTLKTGPSSLNDSLYDKQSVFWILP